MLKDVAGTGACGTKADNRSIDLPRIRVFAFSTEEPEDTEDTEELSVHGHPSSATGVGVTTRTWRKWRYYCHTAAQISTSCSGPAAYSPWICHHSFVQSRTHLRPFLVPHHKRQPQSTRDCLSNSHQTELQSDELLRTKMSA